MSHNSSSRKPTSNFVDRNTTCVIHSAILSHQRNQRLSSTGKTIFVSSFFTVLIILLIYILFRGKVTNTKLNRLVNNASPTSNEIRQIFEEMHQTLKSIELLLLLQSTKPDNEIGQTLNTQQSDLHAFSTQIKEDL